MTMMNGIGVSPGISIGKACVLKKSEPVLNGILLQDETEITAAVGLFDRAVDLALREIAAIVTWNEEDATILETHIELISDPQIREDVVEKIKTDQKNANDALLEVITELVLLFEHMDDEYMSARSADIKDIGYRILKHINSDKTDIQQFEADTIVIAEDISPSDTIAMDINLVTGFATQTGSRTSHAAIIARSKGIPAVVGCGEGLSAILDKDVIILDGTTGKVYVNPSEDLLSSYRLKKEAFREHQESLRSLRNVACATTDGHEIKLLANISAAADMESVFANGGEGAGLLRTELLFMDRDSFPSEDEQFGFYQQAALQSKGKPVIVRTIDIGGDKHLPYFNLPEELNPFLGYRAIRICLDRKDIFMTQLKAVLRAAVFGDLEIMFPMISNVQEIRAAKAVLEEAKAELLAEGVDFKADIKVGIMIEIPSAAVTADILAKEVDFFSIGTNDLCQYTLAVDRMNDKISHLYDPFNPGVLRLISNVIEQGRKYGIPVGMCGEMASETMATLLLLGMGLKEFSMSAASIPSVKSIILHHSMDEARQVFMNVMEMESSTEIINYLKEHIK
jgi:phosphotransferase system enzyme I (PtsI)